MSFFSKKEQIVVILLAVVIVIISMFNFLNKNHLTAYKADNEEKFNSQTQLIDIEEQEIIEDNQDIMIHISGEVYKPGIVELKSGSRVIDAVNLAGGLKKDADLDKINLSKRLVDEEKIYIPKTGEEDIPIEASNLDNSIGNTENYNSKININTCTKEDLTTLPGIGEVLAGRILEYREGNIFRSIDDIKNVSGIGDKKFESIKDLITVK